MSEVPSGYEVGDLVNEHVWTGAEWLAVIRLVDAEPDEYLVGHLINEHVWTGTEWLPTRSTSPEQRPASKPTIKERFREAKALQAASEQQRQKSHPLYEQCGRLVAEGVVAGRRVKIYEKGFVQVGMLSLGAPERLIGIAAQDQTQQKSALGRTLAAGLTLGANVMLSPNKRGSIYLIITTDRKTHNLNMSPPTNSDIRSAHALATAGQAVLSALAIQQQAQLQAPTASVTVERDVAQQIADLRDLHASGALTDEEFSAAKARILGSGT